MPIRLLLFEDNDQLRNSLAWLFEATPDLALCGQFSHCRNAAAEVRKYLPDVVIMDIEMPGMTGIEGVRLCKEANPATHIVMYTVFEDDERLFEAICAGADGYLLKKTSPSRLVEAIREAHEGGSPVSPSLAKRLLKAFQQRPYLLPEQTPSFDLSTREKEILSWLVKGMSYKQIAAACFISVETVRRHLQNIYAKLHVNCGTEAVAKALKFQIVEEK
ncbi:MAG: response regulator transcription factor [Saprospiraceae bacterium]|jgi:DNA-binding NarL/FixJ family response regulator|nr:response regulator transcription factor [Saprospiraceae bacterium]